MSVMHCGDVGCPCRNLPPAVDDTAALRAEVARLRAVVGRVRAMCQPSGYTTWDADEKLPNLPYKPDDPAVVAWEKAHGHDVRLKCYPEFGCQLLLDPEDVLAALDGAA